MCVYILIYMYTDKAVVGLPSSVCAVLCCYHPDFPDFIRPLFCYPAHSFFIIIFCSNSASFLT